MLSVLAQLVVSISIFEVVSIAPASCLTNENQNDNYCDCIDGSDETLTSACSPVSVNLFKCANAMSNESIPFSRVNDGVCDCCDGSDEFTNPHLGAEGCQDTCDSMLHSHRQVALQWYRTVQAGMRSRQEIVGSFTRQKEKEAKVYETLTAQRKDMRDILIKIKYWMDFEVNKERSIRWKLLREREIRCAQGEERACNKYYSGYFDDDELGDVGIRPNYVNEKRRLIFEYSQQELDYLNSLNGVDRIRSQICNVRDLLPDDSPRIQGTLYEYLQFVYSPAASQRRKKNPVQRRYNAMFGMFLEDEENGMILGITVLTEMTGLLISPLTLTISYSCSLLWYIASVGVDRVSLIVADGAQSYLTYAGVESTPSENNVEESARYAPVSDFDDVVRLAGEVCQFGAQDAAILITQLYGLTEKSSPQLYNFVYNELDPFKYSFVISAVDYLYPFTSTIYFFWSILRQAPAMYYDFYVSPRSPVGETDFPLSEPIAEPRYGAEYAWYTNMPPRRQACLLRAGYATTIKELLKLDGEIEDELLSGRYLSLSEHQSNFKSRWYGDVSNDGMIYINPEKVFKHVTKHLQRLFADLVNSLSTIMSDEEKLLTSTVLPEQKRDIDFGADRSWRVAYENKICVSKDWSGYTYDFCFFDEIGQDDFLLGKFSHWAPDDENSRNSDRKNQKHSYNYMVYTDGDKCFGTNLHRSTGVHLKCAAHHELLEVVEKEVCSYEMVVGTPFACTQQLEHLAFQELERLQVFGFSSKASERKLRK